jgi:poly(3-hydroxybutyrate) depolymerase
MRRIKYGQEVLVMAALAVLGCGAVDEGQQREEISGSGPEAVQARAPLLSSPCTEGLLLTCAHNKLDLMVGLATRRVYYSLPQGTPPPGGWPVVLMFQGSFFNAELTFQGNRLEPFGAYYQVLTVKQLLEAGFAVLAPQTHVDGVTFWDTDIPPWSFDWDAAPDNQLMLALFDAIGGGKFGTLNPGRLYAAGISSGGYMTSRMAVSYRGKFKALAIQSASYATCPVGPSCLVPELPADHPPTLFLAGLLDPLVPLWTVQAYYNRLLAEGRTSKLIVGNLASHEWIPAAPDAVVQWFLASP